MTNAAKAFVANYVWLPYGGLHSYTGTTEIDLRFPGQIMQAESGLYYNWNRQYDPTTGRYTQADPLGLVDGSSRYAYVGNDPLQQIDPKGLQGCFGGFCQSGGTYGTTGMYSIDGRTLCFDCAVKHYELQDMCGADQIEFLSLFLIGKN